MSPIVRILENWSLEGGDLRKLLAADREHAITSRSEVDSICHALDALHAQHQEDESEDESDLMILAGFFQNIGSDEAIDAFITEGLPLLRWWVADAIEGKWAKESDILFLLEILAMYRQQEDVAWIVKSAHKPIAPWRDQWESIFDHFRDEHPHVQYLLNTLSHSIPENHIGIALLNLCNQACQSRVVDEHPFDTEAGIAKLKAWMTCSQPNEIGYPRAAAKAIRHIGPPSRNELLNLAKDHQDVVVCLEGLAAAASLGERAGVEALLRHCLDPKESLIARDHLKGLGLADKVPSRVFQEEFVVQAEMAQWLTLESDYGRPPDIMEILEHRSLFWPPAHSVKKLFLVKFVYGAPGPELPAAGVGMVGSVTCSLIGETTFQLPPEDVYGLHCCWELELMGDPLAPGIRTAKIGRNLLRRSNAGF
jgi:hypothetical protein